MISFTNTIFWCVALLTANAQHEANNHITVRSANNGTVWAAASPHETSSAMKDAIPGVLRPAHNSNMTTTRRLQFNWNHEQNVVWAHGCDFFNSDIGNSRVPGEQCSSACENFSGCTHFAWTRHNGGTCWFKRKPGIATSVAVSNPAPGAVCGLLKASSSSSSSSSLSSWVRYSRVGKTITRTRSFSEESNGYSGRQTAPIAGIACSGRYCDNKRLATVRQGTSAPVVNTAHWTRWFTDGNPSWADCPSDMIVNELQCRGRYCDDIRLQCGRLTSDYRVVASDIKTVNWFSEEEGERLCPDGYYLWGMACRGSYCDGIKLNCARVDYKPGNVPTKNVVQDSLPFAPVYFFDAKGPENCLPDWPSSANNNQCRKSFLQNTPSFVEYDICGTFDVYTYWLWWGDQKGCIVFDGGHGDDWEHVSVFVRDGQVQKVTYYQHKGRYTRRRGTFTMSGERPWVYIGKVGHGSYHAGCDGVCDFDEFFTQGCLGSVNYCQGGCGYWDDFRNPGPKLDRYTVYDLQPGATIDGITRPARDVCVSSCEGSGSRLLTTAGCWQNNV